MTEFHIDPVVRKKIITRWVVLTLWSLHIWASMIVIASISMKSPPAELFSSMFSTITTGIGMTIFILLVDKGADFVISKFGTPMTSPATVTETVTRTVETKTPEDTTTEDKNV